MGCHTWFKVKSAYSKEELRQKWIEQQKLWIRDWTVYTNDPKNKYRSQRIFGKHSQEWYEFQLALFKRQLRMVENGTIKQSFINHINGTKDEDLYEIVDGVIYCETDKMPHDLFRKGSYPDKRLFSLKETMKYINDPENSCIIYEDTVELLNEFWNKNPDGMISFG